ncbi:MAG: 6-bladed beta-propeller [Porphyromonadaceae bacterium]|nr:MAG: 6-bladed beta-propeller [Porphyromonadaceae bacterium]
MLCLKLYSASVLLLLLTSCKDHEIQKPGKTRTIEYNKDFYDYSCDYSKVVKHLDLIPLETNANCLIGEITQIIEKNSLYYIFDRSISQTLFIFDSVGNFVNKIHEKGKGPRETVKPMFMAMDEYTNELVLCSNTPPKVLVYDALGIFKREIHVSRPLNAIEVLDSGSYVVRNNGQENQICIIDKQGNNIKDIHSYNPLINSITFKDFTRFGDKVLYHKDNVDTIYQITTKGLQPWIYVDYKENKVTQKQLNEMILAQKKLNRPIGLPLNVINGTNFYSESPDIIYFTFTVENKEGTRPFIRLFHCKNTDHTIYFPLDHRNHPQYNGKYRLFEMASMYMNTNSRGEFISERNPIDIIENMDGIRSLINEGLVTVLGSNNAGRLLKLNEQSNPVLAKFSFNNHF